MAVDAAPPQPMLLVDPGVLSIGGSSRNLGVGAEKKWADESGGLSPREPVSNETGPVGGGAGLALRTPGPLTSPEERGPPAMATRLGGTAPMGVVGLPLPPTGGESAVLRTSLQLLPGLQRLLDGLPLVRGMRPLPPTLPPGMPTESEESVSPLQIGVGGYPCDTHGGHFF